MTDVTQSSGNVFADLNLLGAQDLQQKANLVRKIFCIIQIKNLNFKAAALLMDIPKSELECIISGRFVNISVAKLTVLYDTLVNSFTGVE